MPFDAARARLVAEARTWRGTPYHNQADLKGVGADCGMILVRIFVDLGFFDPFDPRPYSSDWHLHRSEERYLGFVNERFVEVPAPLPGDIIVFRYGRCYSHGGLVTKADPLTLVHAFQPAGVVIEEEISRNAQLSAPARRPRFFSIFPAEST
jgi:cell wall-associated NlpC family hydrolase